MPQKLLPEQHNPDAHFLLTMGPHASPAPAVPGAAVGTGGFAMLLHLPKPAWHPVPQYNAWSWMSFLGPQCPADEQQR